MSAFKNSFLLMIIGEVCLLLAGCGMRTPSVSLGKQAIQDALQEEITEEKTCVYCRGGGKCQLCTGTGKIRENGCPECYGTGKCPLCGMSHIIRKEVQQFKKINGTFIPEPNGTPKKYIMYFQGQIKIIYDTDSSRFEDIKGEITFRKVMPWEGKNQKWESIYVIIREKDCYYCAGTKKCITCKGIGKLNNKIVCPACSGNGKCKDCHGTGINSDWK